MKIRLETKNDYYEVENLTREAFFNVYRPGCFEHLVVHKIRNSSCFIKELDYVIEENDTIVANIIYAESTLITFSGKKKKVLIFGPVSVLPEYQHKGYGSKLIYYTLNEASKLGYDLVLITGSPDYYQNFGFESASKYNIYYNGMNTDEECPFFMIKVLNKNKINEYDGFYREPEYYDIDERELEVFDKLFPFKLKEKREGQLE